MTNRPANTAECIEAANAILAQMTIEEIREASKDMELFFHAICATLATTQKAN